MPHEPIRCFLLHPLPRRRQWLLRRSHAGAVCRSRTGEHRAKVRIEDGEFPHPPPPKSEAPEWIRYRDDPRWPTRCDFCDYLFTPRDERLLFFRRIYGDEEGRELILDEAPAGAMWDAWWLGPEFRGRDGYHLAVMTPGGPWYVDGRSPVTNLHWKRIGTPPNVTVRPSNFIPGRYHGWIDEGFLYEC
jgi:hypothetical protein